jgi:DNA-binding response OmpR family regulator
MNILIVEDDQVLSLMLQQMLREMGYYVIDSVTKGSLAIDKAIELDCELLLMDIMLEDDVDGIQAYECIRKIKNIPVIYITGNSDPLNKQRASKIGYFDFIAKPVIFEELQDSIQSLEKELR